MKYIRSLCISIGLLAIPLIVLAPAVLAQSFRAGNAVNAASGEVVDSSLYAFGQTVTIASEVNGDIICAGQNVVISGIVHGDVICAGQSVVISGQVNGDVRLAGQTVTIDGAVIGNASIAGQTLTVNQPIGGDLGFAGQHMTLSGSVGRDVALAAGSALINSPIGRNIEARVASLLFGSQAHVPGTINYVSEQDATVSQGATVGQLNRTTPQEKGEYMPASPFAVTATGIFYCIATLIFSSLIIALVAPGLLRRVNRETTDRLGWAALTGFIGSIALPILMVICFLTLIGLPLGLLTLAVWLGLSLLSFPVSAYHLGKTVLRNSNHIVSVTLIGSLLLALLLIIPIINVIAGLAAYWIGLGSLLLAVHRASPKVNYEVR